MAETTRDFGGADGHRSLQILEEIAIVRRGSVGTPRASRAVSDLSWQPAQAASIKIDPSQTVWHAGHVTALLTDGVDVVAAAQTGGLWLLRSVPFPTPLAGYTSVQLGDGWDTPDVSCLAWGPQPLQVFVGTDGSAFFLLELEAGPGGLSLKRSTTLPLPFASSNAMVLLTEPNRLVVASGSGVWWSPVPEPATDAAGYDWQPSEGLSAFERYVSIAAGPGASVAVASASRKSGGGVGVSLQLPSAIHRGTLEDGVLRFTEATVEGIDPASMRRTSLASCADDLNRMYAAVEAPDSKLLAVLASTDGGASWSPTPATPDRETAGDRGFYNSCIAVSPQRPEVVVVGWRDRSPFWSNDGGATWSHKPDDEANRAIRAHLHADLHVLHLGRNPDGPEPLYVGSDGGVAVSLDGGRTYHSQFNRPLGNLQFYGAYNSVLDTVGGSLTASSRYPGLLAGGTQDNGNVFRRPDRRRPGVPRQADTFWRRLRGGDGDLNRFVDPLGVLLSFDNGHAKLVMDIWDEEKERFPLADDEGPDKRGPGQILQGDGDAANGVMPTSVEVVSAPAFRRGGQRVYAVVGTKDGVVFGLFAADLDERDTPRQREDKIQAARLVRLGTVGSRVDALSSRDGSTVLVGTADNRIVSLDSASGALSEHALPEGLTGGVTRLDTFTDSTAPSFIPDNAFAIVGGRILRFNGLFWAFTSGSDWVAFAVDEPSGRIFAANDADVFVSHDRGLTWVDASYGLPARPHCTDLRIAADGDGGRDLYLATYGRSVWRATIAQRADSGVFQLPPATVEIILGVIEDGGGIVRVGKRVIKVPPRPLIRDVIAALLSEDAARAMSEESADNARAIRRTALQQIAEIAQREIERLG